MIYNKGIQERFLERSCQRYTCRESSLASASIINVHRLFQLQYIIKYITFLFVKFSREGHWTTCTICAVFSKLNFFIYKHVWLELKKKLPASRKNLWEARGGMTGMNSLTSYQLCVWNSSGYLSLSWSY